jgi:hypothetical protein
LYAANGRLMPFNSNAPTGSTFTAFSTSSTLRTELEAFSEHYRVAQT